MTTFINCATPTDHPIHLLGSKGAVCPGGRDGDRLIRDTDPADLPQVLADLLGPKPCNGWDGCATCLARPWPSTDPIPDLPEHQKRIVAEWS